MSEGNDLDKPEVPVLEFGIEKEQSIDYGKLALLTKLVTNYSNQDGGLSSVLMCATIATRKSGSAEKIDEVKIAVKARLSDFLKIVGEFDAKDTEQMVALRYATHSAISALERQDWGAFNKSSKDLNNVMDGMETVLEIIKFKKD